ncbi:multidrug efflux SMR transporter [Nocardia sp. NPDC024068]|uniref:DMT family transporter n=1 Tax=Nocardia sp. NPDC024068 TaxID=3157197 RepID=UPI0033D6ACC7
MAWIILLASAVCEAVWATALGQSDGFTRPLPTAVFFVALAASMAGLGLAVRRIPIGSAYAVWTGVGTALTVGYTMVTGGEAVTAAKLVCLAGIVVAVLGLELLPHEKAQR